MAQDIDLDKGTARLANGEPLVPVGFDSTLIASTAPDHLISGLLENVLTICFEKMGKNKKRRYVELRIISDANTNGLSKQGKFLKCKDRQFFGIRSVQC